MSTKTLIVICQSGGEFVTSQENATVSYTGGEAYVLDLDQHTQLKDFKKELAETFKCSVNAIGMKYFLPANKKTLITISNDKDLKHMVNFFKDADQVEIFITIDEAAAAQVIHNVPGSRLSRRGVSDRATPVGVRVDGFQTNGGTVLNESIGITPIRTNPYSIEEKHRKAATQWENIITGVDQRFNNFTEFRDALHKYSIAHGFICKFKKNDSHRVTAKCKTEGCPWRIYASKVSTTELVCIKKINPKHTCEGSTVKSGYRATRGLVESLIKEKLKASPNYRPKDIVSDIQREYGIELNYTQAWRAKEIARGQLQGSYKEAYSQLPNFCVKIMETSQGSVATLSTKGDSCFHGIFVSFHALIAGFQHCRPLIFLGSTLLNSKYQGTLLAAMTADGNDDFLPVAFSVVDEETEENWHWFLSQLKSALSTSEKITFVCDFQKGIRESLVEIFGEECYHGYCLRFLAEKLNKDLKGQFSHDARRLMVQDLYAAAFAPNLDEFERCIENIKAISVDAYNWVVQSEPDHWSNAFLGGARYGHMTSTFGQEFYSWVSEVDGKPITQIVNFLRGKIMELIYKRRIESLQWVTKLTPVMENILQNEALKAQFQVSRLNGSIFQVSGDCVEEVDIEHWDCSCKWWQLSGLPCCHAIAVLNCYDMSVYDYCQSSFMTETYRETYTESINPIPSIDLPESSEMQIAKIVAPPPKRTTGRPKVKVIVEPTDIVKRQLQCSQCKEFGHNKQTCDRVNGVEGPQNPILVGLVNDEVEVSMATDGPEAST